MAENEPSSARPLSSVCEEAVAAYRDHGRSIQIPAIRKLLESIISQKGEHVSVLRMFDGFKSGGVRGVDISGSFPADVLESLVSHEKAFAAALDGLAASLADEEARQNVKAIADSSRKFASWAQDHLDLLAMF